MAHCNKCNSILDDYEIGICHECEFGGIYTYKGVRYYRTGIEEGFTEDELEEENCGTPEELFEVLLERGEIKEG